MRVRFFARVMLLLMLLIVVGCSVVDTAYDKAIDNGMTALENEQYADAVTAFEKAVEEKKEVGQAVSYLNQAQLNKPIKQKLITFAH